MMLEVVFFFLYGEMFWSTRVSLVTGVKKWTDSQFKKKKWSERRENDSFRDFQRHTEARTVDVC